MIYDFPLMDDAFHRSAAEARHDPAPAGGWWASPDLEARMDDLRAWDQEMVRYFGKRVHELAMDMLGGG